MKLCVCGIGIADTARECYSCQLKRLYPGRSDLQEAYHQGTLHLTCTHDAPDDYTAEQVAAYDAGTRDPEVNRAFDEYVERIDAASREPQENAHAD